MPSPSKKVVLAIAGFLTLVMGAVQVLLLIISARSVLWFSILSQLLLVPVIASKLLAGKVHEPCFLLRAYNGLVLLMLLGLRQTVFEDYADVFYPPSFAILVSLFWPLSHHSEPDLSS